MAKPLFGRGSSDGPNEVYSTVLTVSEEALCVAFRKHTLLPLDDCPYAVQAIVPHLTRSSLHRLFQRHGISRLPQAEGDKPKKKFKAYPIGYFHIDIAEVRTAERKLHMFVAIDRTSKFAFVELHERATRRVVGELLRHLIEAVPYTIHTVLTDNGTQFTTPGNVASAAPLIRQALESPVRSGAFETASVHVTAEASNNPAAPRSPWGKQVLTLTAPGTNF